jgi:hypothetical protein
VHERTIDTRLACGHCSPVPRRPGKAFEPVKRGYFFAFFACRFSFKVFCAGFFSMLFFAFLSLLAMP